MRNTLWESISLFLILILQISGDENLLATTVTNVDHLPRKISLNQNINYTSVFPCSEPQSRAYNLRDLMEGIHQTPGDITRCPIYIILKRCDVHTGCCSNPDYGCSPVLNFNYIEEIEIKIWNVDLERFRKAWIRVEHHGKCECEFSSVGDRISQENQKPLVEIL